MRACVVFGSGSKGYPPPRYHPYDYSRINLNKPPSPSPIEELSRPGFLVLFDFLVGLAIT